MKRVAVVVGAAAIAVAGCSSNSNSCDTQPVSRRLTIETPTDPALQLRVESCRVDVDACRALCDLALERVQIQTFGVDTCKVGFADTKVLMDVVYTPIQDGCFFPGEGDVVFANGGPR